MVVVTGMERSLKSLAELASMKQSEAEYTYLQALQRFKHVPQCTVDAAIQHFNSGGSVVVRTRGHNVLYAKLWHTEAVLTSAIQESDSFNCVGEIL